MPPPNDLEAGLNGSSQPAPDVYIPEVEKPNPDNAPARGSVSPSIVPSAVERSADPDLKDVWNKWWGKPAKGTQAYSAPPAKGERCELETFQNLVGIHFLRPGGGLLRPEDQGERPASPMHDIFMPTKAAARRWRNRGLYERTLSQDVRSRVLYGMSNYLITFLYLLQILIAAALTGLSAYQQSSSVALTTLGAINTVLAGILAWLNGQGMPVRFRRARDQFREVVRAIEDTERTFAEIDYIDWAPGTRPNPYAERDRLEQMYEEARQDLERNYPDIQEGPNKSQMEGEAKQLKETISGEKSKVGAFAKTLEKTRDDHKKQLKEMQDGFTQRLKDALEEQKDRVRTEVEFQHLQKVAEEQKRKYEEEKAEFEARMGGKPRQPRDHSPRTREQPGKAPERPREESKPHGKPQHEEPKARPREVPRERSRARSPSRPRAKSPARSPVRAPARQAKSPSRPRARSPSRSPARHDRSPARKDKSPSRPRDRSPPRSPARAAKSSPKPRARSPAKSPARSPARGPARSPARPAKSPSRGPAKPAQSPSRPSARSPARPPGRPSRSPSRSSSRPRAKSPNRSPPRPRDGSPEAGPRSGGPPGLFTNIF